MGQNAAFFLPENGICQFCPLYPSYLWNYREKKKPTKGKNDKKIKMEFEGGV